MATESDLRQALEVALPTEFSTPIADLSHLLWQVITGTRSLSEAQSEFEKDQKLKSLVAVLAGQEISTNTAVVSFGKDSQYGDVTINDVAANSIIKLTVNIYNEATRNNSLSDNQTNKPPIIAATDKVTKKAVTRKNPYNWSFAEIGRDSMAGQAGA